LFAVTGMRVGEAIRLDRSDINSTNRLLIVRDSKFGKSREVALHPSTIMALRSYPARRDRPIPSEATTAAFTSRSSGSSRTQGCAHARELPAVAA